jgi:Kef-type K+ transport system membrane component KefB
MESFINYLHNLPVLLIIGAIILVAFLFGKLAQLVKLPSLIGFMFVGVLLGPSLLNILGTVRQEELGFITQIALGFVALSIGLELNFSSLKKLGSGIVWIIFAESIGTFVLVTGMIFLLTKNLPLALILGGIAPASAPEGTVSVSGE